MSEVFVVYKFPFTFSHITFPPGFSTNNSWPPKNPMKTRASIDYPVESNKE